MGIRKFLASIGVGIGLLSGVAQAQSQNVQVSSSNYKVLTGIVWDTRQWSNILNQQIQQFLLNLGGVINTPIVSIPLGQLLVNVWNGISCKIPFFTGNIPDLYLQIPSKISVKLPCNTVYIDFTPDWTRLINKVTGSINAFIPDWLEHCIHNPTDPMCAKNVYRYYVKNYFAFNTLQVQGVAVKQYAQKTNQEINQEIKNDAKSLSQAILPTINSNGKNVYNVPILKANLGTMKEAGSSTGKLAYPDKKQVESLPEPAKTAYAYVVSKQVAREKVIQMFQNRINGLFQELFAIKQTIDSYCQTPIKGVNVIPPTIGGLGGIVKVDLDKLKNLALNRCCCCDAIPAIHSAKSVILTRISAMDTHIATEIQKATLEITKTISAEAYKTRLQIHNEFMNLQANEKSYRCMEIKLEYLKVKTQIYNLMMQLAQLETMYANLNSKEKEQLEKQLTEYLKKLK
jgi:hypothetical protein